MIAPDAIVAGIRIVRAEEAWEPVLLGGMIPILGALAIVWLIWRAVKDNPEDDLPPEHRPSSPSYRPPEEQKEGGPEDPPPE
ncbi:MAG TPA: hypothetical protein VHV53_10530 [Solirubrobacterales bacterium]|jgi:hypothetical protein|nr:hypothetical protein [Solirubrobacterales bacterium]